MGLREFTSVPADPREWGRWMRAQFITADTVAANTITTGMIVDNQVTFAKLQDISALSVIGRPVNSIGDPSAIVAGTDFDVLRRSGATIGFGALTSAFVSDFNEAAQDAALSALTDSSELDWTYNDGAGTASAALVSASVANSKLANMAADTIKGRANGAGTGSPTDLNATQVATIISSAVASALNITAGTYTPTLTNVTNLSASTANLSHYLRVGSMVIVMGYAGVDPTAAGNTELGISLPIASNLTTDTQLVGNAAALAVAGQSAGIVGSVANDRARMIWVAVDTSNVNMFYLFMYLVV